MRKLRAEREALGLTDVTRATHTAMTPATHTVTPAIHTVTSATHTVTPAIHTVTPAATAAAQRVTSASYAMTATIRSTTAAVHPTVTPVSYSTAPVIHGAAPATHLPSRVVASDTSASRVHPMTQLETITRAPDSSATSLGDSRGTRTVIPESYQALSSRLQTSPEALRSVDIRARRDSPRSSVFTQTTGRHDGGTVTQEPAVSRASESSKVADGGPHKQR